MGLELGHIVPQFQTRVTCHCPINPGELLLIEPGSTVLEGVSDEAKPTLGVDCINDGLGVFGVGDYIFGDIESQVVIGLGYPLGVVNLFAHEEEGVPIPALFSFGQDVVIGRDDKVQLRAPGDAGDFLVGGGAIRTGSMKMNVAHILVEIHGCLLLYDIRGKWITRHIIAPKGEGCQIWVSLNQTSTKPLLNLHPQEVIAVV
jgi:hypothetical protein